MSSAPAYLNHPERFVEAGPYRTRYLEAGRLDRPTIVLVHDGAYGTDAELCWQDVIRELAVDHRVLAPELLGWGGTDKIVNFGRSRYENQIAHLAAFCAALGVEEADFVGTSFGGSVVVRAASEGSECRLPMRSVVSLSGTGGPYRCHDAVVALGEYVPSPEGAEAISRLIMQPAEPSREHVERRYRVSLTHGHWEALKAQQVRRPGPARRTGASGTAGSARYPATFAQARMPVLLVEGLADPINEPGWAHRLASYLPAAEVLHLESGHSPNLDRPAEVAAAIHAFRQRCSASPTGSG